MNQTWVKSMQLHYRHLYPGQRTIDIQQLLTAIKLVPDQQRNGFVSYAIRNSSDDKKNADDRISFPELINRISSIYRDPKDTIYLDAYFKLLDTDGDGFVSHDDLEAHTPELGVSTIISEKGYFQLMQKLAHEGAKIGKNQFIEIVRQYL